MFCWELRIHLFYSNQETINRLIKHYLFSLENKEKYEHVRIEWISLLLVIEIVYADIPPRDITLYRLVDLLVNINSDFPNVYCIGLSRGFSNKAS